jgi:hypothetical protein
MAKLTTKLPAVLYESPEPIISIHPRSSEQGNRQERYGNILIESATGHELTNFTELIARSITNINDTFGHQGNR